MALMDAYHMRTANCIYIFLVGLYPAVPTYEQTTPHLAWGSYSCARIDYLLCLLCIKPSVLTGECYDLLDCFPISCLYPLCNNFICSRREITP